MLFPKFSIRLMLLLTSVFAMFLLIVNFAIVGEKWAVGLSIGIASVPLFFLAYGSIVLGAFHGIDKPNLILEFLQTKTLVVLIRIVSLYLTPLDAPKDTILLVDPFAHGDSPPLVRDLFFSGHTSTTFVVFFTCRFGHWRWKLLFLAMGLITGVLVILQKTHFVVDVWAAPFFVYAAHRIVYCLRSYFMAIYTVPSTSNTASNHEKHI